MKVRKIEIVADFAHFKIPYATKYHRTYPIPPISTVVGILQNLFHKDIDNFILGFLFSSEGIFKDIQTFYKEVNLNIKKENDRYKNGKWNSDIVEIHYLFKPKLIIYTDIKDDLVIDEPLNLGKTDCLAKITSITDIELDDKDGIGYDQWTSQSIGEGKLKRIATETKYNEQLGIYDIYTELLRYNKEFEYSKFYDSDEEQNIFLWEWKRGGIVNEFK